MVLGKKVSIMKLDFSQAKAQAVGTAFWAMSVEVNTKTKQQLEAEESVGQSSDVSKASDSSKTEDKTVSPNDSEQTILFADPTNGNLVKIDLSKENIEKLKKHFTDENNFYERADGSIRLNGKAEAYVSGWFGDIAYKREFLKADADGDGKLSDDEYQNTRNEFSGEGEAHGTGKNVISVKETITEQYVKVDSDKSRFVKYHQSDKKSKDIDDELNKTLKMDSNIDGTIDLQEVYSYGGQNHTKVILSHATKALGNIDPGQNPFADKTSETLKLLLEKINNEEAQKALQKLRAANGNESVLTAEEKEALGTELKAIKKQLESKDELNSVKDELKMKIENTQFIDVRG